MRDAITSQLERIRHRLGERGLLLNPPVSFEAVSAFESRHGIALPEGYRRFITELGDGGPGPIYYGILPPCSPYLHRPGEGL